MNIRCFLAIINTCLINDFSKWITLCTIWVYILIEPKPNLYKLMRKKYLFFFFSAVHILGIFLSITSCNEEVSPLTKTELLTGTLWSYRSSNVNNTGNDLLAQAYIGLTYGGSTIKFNLDNTVIWTQSDGTVTEGTWFFTPDESGIVLNLGTLFVNTTVSLVSLTPTVLEVSYAESTGSIVVKFKS